MYHGIEIVEGFTVDVEVSTKQPLERLRIHKGTQMTAQLKPYVVETQAGPVEVADLYLDDGSTIRMVPFGYFRFVEGDEKE